LWTPSGAKPQRSHPSSGSSIQLNPHADVLAFPSIDPRWSTGIRRRRETNRTGHLNFV
jgi:hypothetical protein